ncbi:MAG: hypothetical protein WCD18_27495 [Thermosynechococcaceae cyanobacterium]
MAIPDETTTNTQAVFPLSQSPQTVSQQCSMGDRVRIIRRQNGQDKWSGYIGNIWEITVDGWLRVAIEGKTGVRFTLHPDWVELLENSMTDNNPAPTFAEQIKRNAVRLLSG